MAVKEFIFGKVVECSYTLMDSILYRSCHSEMSCKWLFSKRKRNSWNTASVVHLLQACSYTEAKLFWKHFSSIKLKLYKHYFSNNKLSCNIEIHYFKSCLHLAWANVQLLNVLVTSAIVAYWPRCFTKKNVTIFLKIFAPWDKVQKSMTIFVIKTIKKSNFCAIFQSIIFSRWFFNGYRTVIR